MKWKRVNLTHSEMLKDKVQTQDENQLLVSWVTKQFTLVTHVFFADQVMAQSNRMSPQLVFHYLGNEKNNVEAQIVLK